MTDDKKSASYEPKSKLTGIIGELVTNLHANCSADLTIVLPTESHNFPKEETADFQIIDNTLCFSSLEARNHFLATYLFKKHQEEFQADLLKWLHTARDLWRHEIGSADRVSGRLMALVHEIEDIFLIAASVIENKTIDVFKVLHIIEAALPYLNKIEPKSIYILCATQHEKTKNDLAAGFFFNQLEKLLTRLPLACRLIHSHLRYEISQTTVALYPTALIALSLTSESEAVTLAYEDAESQNDTLKRAALWTLGLLFTSKRIAKDIIPVVSAIIVANISDPDEQVRRTAIHAAAQAITVTRKFDSSLINLGGTGDQEVLTALSQVLLSNSEKIKATIFLKKWVSLLCNLKPSSIGAIDNFDYILMGLLSDKLQQQFVISCLTEWTKINGNDTPRDKSFAELFDSTVLELTNRKELLSQIITEWFSSDSRKLASAASGLLSHLWVHNFKNPEFSTELLDTFIEADFLYLVRRMLGFVYSDEHLLSLTLSLLKTKDPQRIFGIVHSVLADEVGMDYPGSTIKKLEEARISTTEAEWITLYSSVIDRITEFMDSIDALPRIEELKPPPNIQRQFAKAQAKQMNNMVEDARKGSILRQICTEIPIKAGKGCFSFRDGNYTDTSNMQSISHSVPLPRRHVLDSVGYELSRLMMRCVKREEV